MTSYTLRSSKIFFDVFVPEAVFIIPHPRGVLFLHVLPCPVHADEKAIVHAIVRLEGRKEGRKEGRSKSQTKSEAVNVSVSAKSSHWRTLTEYKLEYVIPLVNKD